MLQPSELFPQKDDCGLAKSLALYSRLWGPWKSWEFTARFYFPLFVVQLQSLGLVGNKTVTDLCLDNTFLNGECYIDPSVAFPSAHSCSIRRGTFIITFISPRQT